MRRTSSGTTVFARRVTRLRQMLGWFRSFLTHSQYLEEVKMPGEAKPTAEVNGVLWGTRSADWASLQEAQCRPVYEAVLERLSVGPGTVLLDAGCGAGLASQMAASRGARVTGLDASEALLAIAQQRVP